MTGDEAKVKSTIVIDLPLKKQELKLQHLVSNDKSGWKVFDVIVLGDSMLAGIHDDQVRPLLKSGEMNALLNAMRKKNQELSQPRCK